LAGGGLDEIGTANDFRDAHGRVIDDDGELIGGYVVATPDEEISEVSRSEKALRTEVLIMKLDGFAVGYAESPVHACRRCGGLSGLAGARAAGSGIEGLVVFLLGLVRSLRGSLEILARTFAGIDCAGVKELLPCGEVRVAAQALRVGREGAAYVRAFLPFDAEPAQVFQHGLLEVGAGAMRVEVLVSKDKGAACGEAALIRGEEGARVAEMEEACGRRRYAAAIGGHGISLSRRSEGRGGDTASGRNEANRGRVSWIKLDLSLLFAMRWRRVVAIQRCRGRLHGQRSGISRRAPIERWQRSTRISVHGEISNDDEK
jgi:hypothetical protein